MRPGVLTVLFVQGGLLAFAACASEDSAAPPVAIVEAGDGPAPDAAVDAAFEDGAARGTADIVLLAMSDWRGQVEPIVDPDAKGIPRPFGGLPALTTYMARERAQNPNTLLLLSGDSFGSSPLVSSVTGDVLAAKGLDLMHATAQAVGPHDFDRGTTQLRTLLELGHFRITSTNLENVVQVLGPRPVTPFLIVNVATGDASPPIMVAVLGLTDWALKDVQFPSNLDEITVRASADLAGTASAANEAAANARLIGADVVLALANVGAGESDGGTSGGPLFDLAAQLRGVDVLVGGETDRAFTTAVGGMLVVQNRNKGRTYARVKLHVGSGASIVTSADIVEPLAYDVVRPSCDAGTGCLCPLAQCPDSAHVCDPVSGFCRAPVVPLDPTAQSLVGAALAQLAAYKDTQITVASDAFPRDGTTEQLQETALGDLVADAMRDRYAAQVALLPGSRLHAALPSPYDAPKNLNRSTPPFDLVYGDISNVLSDGDSVVVRRLSGQTLWQILETSVAAAPAKSDSFLQVSGLSFTYSVAPDAGSRIKSVTLDGGFVVPPTDPTLYTVAVVEPMSRGLLGFPLLVEPVPTLTRELLADVLASTMKKAPLTPVKTFTRVTKVP